MAETDSSKLNIRLHIYDMDIPVKVPRDEEVLYRKAASFINDRLNAYFKGFKGLKGDKEICYYAMIDIALRMEKQLARNDTQPYDEVLLKLTSEIEEALGEKNSGKE